MVVLTRVLAAVVAAWLMVCPSAARAQETLERDVKAAFLYNFTKFVEWPASAFQSAADPLRICVLADAAFTRSVDEIIVGEKVRGRALQRVTPAPSELARCHVLYFGTAESARAEKLLSGLGAAPVLAVGESPEFLEHGGTIAFALVNDRVRFDVNILAAQRAGVTISSKLLRIARDVKGATRP